MSFEFLLAVISTGLYVPLLLMAGGLLLAVGGTAFLWWRRRKSAQPSEALEEYSPETADVGGEVASEPAPATGFRRRKLVGGAERDDGTPAGGNADEETVPFEPAIEEAEFSEDSGSSELSDDEAAEVASEEPADVVVEDELEPEWIEADTAPVEGATDLSAAGAAAAIAATHDLDEEDQNEAPSSIAADIELSPEVADAHKNPIVFRQFLPHAPGEDGLSFFGGEPIGPADFEWPRARREQGGAPLQFIMQWDCAQLTEADPTGLLPKDGVLYCFINCDRKPDEDFLASHTFIHHSGPATGWEHIAAPEDAGPALGYENAFKLSGCTHAIENAADYAPRTLPRFPFAPMSFDYPETLGDSACFWADALAATSLYEIQKSGVAIKARNSESGNAHKDLDRPFPAFPHDFGAIRVLASHMIDALAQPDEVIAEALYPSLSAQERGTQFAAWSKEAQELYMLGTQRPQSHKLEQNIADDIWQWFETRKGIMGPKIPAMVEEAVDLSLGVSSEALSNVPAHWIDAAMHSHALASESEADNGHTSEPPISAKTPARMFGPPSFGDGEAKERVGDHILLLELPSGAGPQHHFGGKTLQYWIAPDDLAAGNFGAVKQTVIQPS